MRLFLTFLLALAFTVLAGLGHPAAAIGCLIAAFLLGATQTNTPPPTNPAA